MRKVMNRRYWNQALGLTAVAAAQCLIAVLLYGAPKVCAQHLPVRHYSVNDGLANSNVRCVYQDRKGYLWFGTGDGLSRFDGYRFTSYGPRDGLEHPVVHTIIEDRQGRIWVGTWGSGVARLTDQSERTFSLGQGDSRRRASRK